MSTPRPLHSFLGGLGLALPVHALLLLNGDVFGISGFLHRAFRGSVEAIASDVGLLLGGVFAGLKEENERQLPIFPTTTFPQLILSGLLVGVGTKMANGCTSGHMLAGMARFSARSIAATVTFFSTGVITARNLHGNVPATGESLDWSLDSTGRDLLAFQAVPLIISALIYIFAPRQPCNQLSKGFPQLRLIASFVTSFQFALALRLSNLTETTKVIYFLLLPFHKAFDPSLAFLAFGALPMAAVMYQFARGPEQPKLGGQWSVPKNGAIDKTLLVGSALFGIGWGLSGYCPGPGIVNLGRALGEGSDPLPTIVWLMSVVAGGFMV